MTMHRTEERGAGHKGREQGGGQPGGEVYASDPVCGMDVAVSDGEFTVEVADEVYYFCSQSCRSRFARHPDKYT